MAGKQRHKDLLGSSCSRFPFIGNWVREWRDREGSRGLCLTGKWCTAGGTPVMRNQKPSKVFYRNSQRMRELPQGAGN